MPPRYSDDDVDFGVGDYDLLSPPQRPASDLDCSASSNRSSVTSVMSGGSLSSGCASVRSFHSPSVCVGRITTFVDAQMNGCALYPADQLALRRCVSEVTSDTSADSGIALQPALNFPLKDSTSTLNGVSCPPDVTADDNDCLDYDVPVVRINDLGEQRPEVDEIQHTATPQRQCPSLVRHVSSVFSDDLRRRNDVGCADDDRRRRFEKLRDCAMRSIQRFLAWSRRATGDSGTDAATTRQCYGQAKLAGLAVRTSLKELVAVVDANPPELLHHHINPLNKSLCELDRRLDRLIASGSEGSRLRHVTGSTAGGRRESSACRQYLLAVAEIVSDLSESVKRFANFVITNSAVVVRPQDDIDVIQSSTPPPSVVINDLPPVPPQRTDSHQRDKPPLSPPAVTSGSSRARRPPLGKPPPVKPKPPKSVSWKRPPQAPVHPRPPGSPASGTSVSRPTSAKHERRVDELNQKNTASTDGWTEDDCDYVSIVREVAREMECRPAMTPLNDDDRELLAFYSAQISTHAADVDAATADFHRCCPSSSASPPVDVFVRRSRFVVLAAHRLVYVGDVIARHVTDQSLRDRVAAAANALCDQLKVVVMATRDAAVATADNGIAAAAADVRQTMMDSVRRATDDSHRLCDIIASACR